MLSRSLGPDSSGAWLEWRTGFRKSSSAHPGNPRQCHLEQEEEEEEVEEAAPSRAQHKGNHTLSPASLLPVFNALQRDFVYRDQSGFDKIIAGGQEEIAVLPNA